MHVVQDSSGALTETGRKMARLPVDPPLAAALLAAAELQCASDAVAVVALLSSDRVILTPASRFAFYACCRPLLTVCPVYNAESKAKVCEQNRGMI